MAYAIAELFGLTNAEYINASLRSEPWFSGSRARDLYEYNTIMDDPDLIGEMMMSGRSYHPFYLTARDEVALYGWTRP